MKDHPRPSFSSAFVAADRRLRPYFYTSNLTKYLQAKLLLEKYGLNLAHFKSKTDPYFEDYSLGTEVLLERAIEEISRSVGHASLFFVEDTSLRLEALSDTGADYPGLAVKDWFQQIGFRELDRQLKRRGNDRRASIRSDIALHLPGLERVVYFHGESRGEVASTPPRFAESVQHPWLTPNTFNGWFVPNGATKRLGELSFEESLRYDFRAKSLTELVHRLEEYAAALNLPSGAYSRPTRVADTGQLSLLGGPAPLVMAIGRTCAGKTTFGEYCSLALGLKCIEASSVLRLLSGRRVDEPRAALEMAKTVLGSQGLAVVAERIVEVFADELRSGAVITGFRALEEVMAVRRLYPHAKLVWIESSERTRYYRHLSRGRGGGELKGVQEFRSLDRNQDEFGLLGVGRLVADAQLGNEGTMEEYHRKIRSVLESSPGPKSVALVRGIVRRRAQSQLYRCLRVLEEAGSALASNDIAARASAGGASILANNVNKTLRAVPMLAERLESGSSEIRYALRDSGKVFLRLTEKVGLPRVQL